jgi:hypothetical protein
MKKFYALIPLILFFSCIDAQVNIRFGISTKYTDNVFNLSSQDIDKFDEGNNAFSYIETRDDLIINSFFRISKDLKLKRFKLSPFLSINQHSFLENNLKSNTSFKLGFNKKILKKINLKFSYTYYPKIFVRKYIDQDGTKEYENYQYDKQKIDFNGFYKINGKNFILFDISLSQFYYNKYFTEYDGNKSSFGLGIKHSFKPFYLKIKYNYTKFIGNDLILTPENYTGYVRDPRYESNLYTLKIQSKKIKNIFPNYLEIKLSSTFEQRYFTTDLYETLDPIHSGRKDKILILGFEIEYNLLNNTNIFLDLSNASRKVCASYENLSNIKNYKLNEASLGFKYSFSL